MSERQLRGKLKLFLGYATGVGKTYAMLEAAHQRRQEKVDVLVGYVETHGYRATEDLLHELEVVPRLHTEMDTDVILARKPQLVLVDDLAHANAPGARHAKRYQDIEELLSAGINVYTTANIQNLESLNDVVAQITGTIVHETVPDRILDMVDEIELVDLPPEELIQRFREGKVYSTEDAEKFYRAGNLIALREMALRHTAARVDEQMRAYKKAHAIFYTWAATDRLLVAISPNPLSERLVRTGRRLANQLNAEWFVLYVETPRAARLSDRERDRITRTMHLAEELGARAVTIPGQTISDSILQYARSHNITQIIVGKSWGLRWTHIFGETVVDRIIHNSGDINIYVISAAAESQYVVPRLTADSHHPWRQYLYSIGLVVFVSVIGQPIHLIIDPTNLVMFYLLAVVVAATRWGRGPSVLTVALSVLAFDFFMVPPRLTLSVSDAQYFLTFFGLLMVGLVISTLAVREREQAEAAKHREIHTAALYDLSRDLTTAVDLDAVIQIAMRHLIEIFHFDIAVFLPKEGTLILRARSPQFPVDQEVANWVFKRGQIAGQGTNTLATVEARYMPLKTAQGVMGVLGFKTNNETLSRDQQRLLEALLSQVALAIEAVQLANNARQAQLLREAEKLQTALLNSVSHNLRTPLSSITGALSSLRDDDPVLTANARQELVGMALEESERLNRLVSNLLNMTRLESGAIKLSLEACDVQDLVGVTLTQMSSRLRHREIKVDVPQQLPPVAIDLVLGAQALVNLVDNAVKYSPPDTPIEIRAYTDQQQVVIEVIDQGVGIPPSELELIFDKFYRVQRVNDSGGTGLGLSISKGIVELLGGQIEAQNRAEGGTIFGLTLPIAESEPLVQD
ncbi:MAG TPA: sensor histidine kinase KdpD [Aggregatilineaceae bacterium]|nr:sensor histidine kinase KdpD [Aggregatilineaceae bacterium]